MKRFFLILMILTFCVSCARDDGLIKVGIVQIVESPPLDNAVQGVLSALNDGGFIDGENIRIYHQNAQGELVNIPLIIQNFINRNVDLIITVGTPCMVSAAQAVKDIPVVFTVAFSPQDAGIDKPPPNITGLYDPYTMYGFIAVIKEAYPKLKKIGLPYNPAEVNSQFAAKKIIESASENNIEVILMPVNSISEIPSAAQALASRNVEFFVVSADNTVTAGLPALVKTASDYKIPIAATESTLVKSGAAIGYGIDYYDWGKASGKQAVQILKGVSVTELPSQPYIDYKLYISLKNAQSQGLILPESILARAVSVD